MLVIGFGVVALDVGRPDARRPARLLHLPRAALLADPLARAASPTTCSPRRPAPSGCSSCSTSRPRSPTAPDAAAAAARPCAASSRSTTSPTPIPARERPALATCRFAVEPGEIVALVGPSGAGKSTLARLLVRFADPQAGAIRLDGHDLRDVTLRSLREHVGLLLQDTLPARRDRARGDRPGPRRRDATTRSSAAARAAGIHDVLEALPDGLDTRIGPGGGRLSGGPAPPPGHRARLRARHAGARPRRADHGPRRGGARPTCSSRCRRSPRGRTTILITHDPVVVGWADRVLELRDGALVPARRCRAVRPLGRGPRDRAGDARPRAPAPLERARRLRRLERAARLPRDRQDACGPTGCARRGAAAKLLREGRLLMRLTHPHIVRAYEVHADAAPGRRDGDPDGRDARAPDRRRAAARSARSSSRTSAPTSPRALTPPARATGILHLDLKPSNVVAEARPREGHRPLPRAPRRAACGRATAPGASWRPSRQRGGVVGAAADVWGLGIVLYAAATRHAPARGHRRRARHRRAAAARPRAARCARARPRLPAGSPSWSTPASSPSPPPRRRSATCCARLYALT